LRSFLIAFELLRSVCLEFVWIFLAARLHDVEKTMNIFKKINLAQKLPILMIGLTALAICVSGFVSYRQASSALLVEAEEVLETIAEARAIELEIWLTSMDIDIRSQAGNPTILSAVRGLGEAWNAISADQTEYLQKVYIDDNPNSVGEKDGLAFADDGSAYSQVHKLYHDYFKKLVDENGYYDVFILNTDGEMLYSVLKETDFATNFLTGPHKDTGLGDVVRKSLAATDATIVFQDYENYTPSIDAPAAFLGAPIIDRLGNVKGVIAFQLASDRTDSILQRRTGLGETGDAYMVGTDFLLRSNPVLGDVDGARILVERVESEAAQKALQGETGLLIQETQNSDTGEIVENVAAYRSIDFHGVRWGLVTEQDIDEILTPAFNLRDDMIRDGLIMMAVVALLGYLISRSISRPLTRVEHSMRSVSAGDYSAAVSGTERGDEIGGIAKALDEFRSALSQAERATKDGLFKGSAFEGSSAALMIVDQNFDIIYMNTAASSLMTEHQSTFATVITDFDASTLIGKNSDIFHQDPEHIRQILSDSSKLPYAADIKFNETYFSLHINAVIDLSGAQIGCVMEWKDVTDIRTSEAVIAALDSTQAKAEFNLKGEVLTANANFAAMTKATADDLQGRKFDTVLSFDASASTGSKNIWARMLQGESVSGRFDILSGAGESSLLDGTLNPVLDASGKPFRIILLGNDITESDRALRRSRREQETMKEQQDTVVEGLRVGLKRLAEGDLTSQILDPFSEDYESLRNDFNIAMTKLLDAMRSVVENADMIRGEASEISNAADDLSRRTEKQAATLEETATALDELTSSVSSAADGANQASQMVETAKANAEASGEVVQEAVEAMSEIESSSNQISKITSVIDDIAFQTNLLALNAGVEAARAGEAGRGFAVVASEVRALAQRSSEAAREINDLISKSGSLVKRGVGLVGETGDALKGIVKSVTEIAINVNEIAESSREQSSGLAEINAAVNQLDQVTQQNAAMFEETTAASHALTREAENLTVTTSRFAIISGSNSDEKIVIATDFSQNRRSEISVDNQASEVAKEVVNAPTISEPVKISDDWEDF
jgi:methyl-accepting chemotaxis protein